MYSSVFGNKARFNGGKGIERVDVHRHYVRVALSRIPPQKALHVVFADVVVSLSAGFLLLPFWGEDLSIAVWVSYLVPRGVVDYDSVVLSTYPEALLINRTRRA